MRHATLAVLAGILFASQAQAAPPLRLKAGLPYPAVVARLRAAGFAPAKIISEGGPMCGPGASPCRSPVIDCAGDRDYCERLFVRRSDEALFIVATHAGADLSGAEDTLLDIAPATRPHLQEYDLVVVTPSGKRRSFVRPAADDKNTPLCGQAHAGPCWVKPPPGSKAPAASSH